MNWEYKILNYSSRFTISKEDILNSAGKDGWELVSVIDNNNDDWIIFYFKRPLIGEDDKLFVQMMALARSPAL